MAQPQLSAKRFAWYACAILEPAALLILFRLGLLGHVLDLESFENVQLVTWIDRQRMTRFVRDIAAHVRPIPLIAAHLALCFDPTRRTLGPARLKILSSRFRDAAKTTEFL